MSRFLVQLLTSTVRQRASGGGSRAFNLGPIAMLKGTEASMVPHKTPLA